MKKIAGCLILLGLFFGQSINLLAIDIGNSPPPVTSPDMFISLILENNTNPVPDYLEVYNQSGAPINLTGWNIVFTVTDNSNCASGLSQTIDFPAGWLLSKNYLAFDSTAAQDPARSAVFTIDPTFTECDDAPWLSQLEINKGQSQQQLVIVPSSFDPLRLQAGVKHRQRDNSPNSTRTLSGDFETDYSALSTADTSLYSDPLYLPPADASGLEIAELLPHSSNCSPIDKAVTCSDYIKILNNSKRLVDLSSYRLRTSYGGSQSTASNTVNLSGLLQPDKYALVNSKNDGSPLSLTEGGGYIWLEDSYGTTIYQPVTSYPDASSTGKVGWAWAFDGQTWRWTSSPQPLGPNVFPPVDIAALSLSVSTSLNSCATGQYRNPATNRCKSIITSSSVASLLKPCSAGQERNPATNRCRKSGTTLGASTLNVADVAAPAIASSTQWVLAGGAMAAAVGYGLFEWRQEILLAFNDNKLRLLAALKNLRN